MWDDIRGAFCFLTVLPMRCGNRKRPPADTLVWFPFVGLIIGLLVALVAQIPAPPYVRAWLMLVAWVMLSGGLHLDGFADSCDGLLASVTPSRRLDIMKDPRTGSWAVIGLMLLLLGKWSLLTNVTSVAVIAPPIAARWGMVTALYGIANARPEGLGADFRRGFTRRHLIAASVGAALAVLIATRSPVLLVVFTGLSSAVVFGVGHWAAQRLGGGITGDVVGAIAELIELVTLFAVVIYG